MLVYKFPKLSREEIEQMLGLSELRQTRVYQEAKAEGKAEGKAEASRMLILRQLTRKLGELPLALTGQIEALSFETLEDLGEALLEFEAIMDLAHWLEKQ